MIPRDIQQLSFEIYSILTPCSLCYSVVDGDGRGGIVYCLREGDNGGFDLMSMYCKTWPLSCDVSHDTYILESDH